MKKKPEILKAALVGFGIAITLAGAFGVIAAAVTLAWLKMAGAACAFGVGMTMILIGGNTDGES